MKGASVLGGGEVEVVLAVAMAKNFEICCDYREAERAIIIGYGY
jgi:hypothetical protein